MDCYATVTTSVRICRNGSWMLFFMFCYILATPTQLWNVPTVAGVTIIEVSMRTWAVSLDPRPNRTWACARILFFNSAQAYAASVSSHRYDGITRGSDFFDIVRFTDSHRAIYVNLRKNNTHKISRIVRTECQKSFHSCIHQHACAEKFMYFYICLLKIQHAHAKKFT